MITPSRWKENVIVYRVISADDHVDMQWLPRGLGQKRVPPHGRARAVVAAWIAGSVVVRSHPQPCVLALDGEREIEGRA